MLLILLNKALKSDFDYLFIVHMVLDSNVHNVYCYTANVLWIYWKLLQQYIILFATYCTDKVSV